MKAELATLNRPYLVLRRSSRAALDLREICQLHDPLLTLSIGDLKARYSQAALRVIRKSFQPLIGGGIFAFFQRAT